MSTFVCVCVCVYERTAIIQCFALSTLCLYSVLTFYFHLSAMN